MKLLRIIALSLGLITLTAFCMTWDVFAVGSPYFLVRYGPYFALIGVCLCLIATARNKWMTLAMIPIVGLALFCASTDWHPRKRFIQVFHLVKPGMPIGEVDQIMTGYYAHPLSDPLRDTPREANGAEEHVVYRWSKAAYDADIGRIIFRAGKVTHTEFSLD